MQYLVICVYDNNIEKSIQCVTIEEAIETYNRLCNYYYNDDALAKFMQNNNYEEKTTEVYDNYYKSKEYYDFEDNSNVVIINICIQREV